MRNELNVLEAEIIYITSFKSPVLVLVKRVIELSTSVVNCNLILMKNLDVNMCKQYMLYNSSCIYQYISCMARNCIN